MPRSSRSIWQGLPARRCSPASVAGDYYDAASVDGAGLRAVQHVTLPLLTPSLFFTGILSLIGSFQVFDQVFVLSRPGKPTDATITMVYFIYENGFRNFKMGYASAASWVLFMIVAVLMFVYFRSQRRWVYYQ
jgi:multiple sugar transport system permease protein